MSMTPPDETDALRKELRAVIDETAHAASTIMDACEKIEKIAQGLSPSPSRELKNIVTTMYEACGFQDIMVQRVNKVMRLLQTREPKVLEKGNDNLLDGPQLKDRAATQEEIDKIFSSPD